MIIQRSDNKVQVTGNVERYQASIAMNPETFSILIDGIYKDKPLAAVREPLFNAVDAHTEAGCSDKPIIIHSPTDLEPWYSVKDTGLGMDHEMVTRTFMMIGESTKRNSNDLIGAKGIGSKAPLAVTDMFTVVSVKDGVKTTYSVHKNSGIPEVVPLFSCETTEENGVEVKFNVNTWETGAYRLAIVKCLRYAKFPYIINDPFVKTQIEDRTYPVQYRYEDEETGWVLEMYSSMSRNADSVVIMGQQPYLSDYLSTRKELPMMTVSIPIGDCNVDPGREWTVEGKNDGGFRDKLESFVTKAIRLRGEEITKELSDLPTLKAVLEHMKYVGGYFATKYGAAFIANKFKNYTDGSYIDYCETYGGEGSRRGKDERYSYAELMNGHPLVYNDDHKYVRSKCNWLAEKFGKRSFITDADYALSLYSDKFFEGMIFKLSELEKRPVQKADKKYGGYGYYEPGHKVWIINQDGSVDVTRISRAQFEDIEAAMVYWGGQVKGLCPLGYVSNLRTSWRKQPPTFLKNLGVVGKLYIVPLNRSSWLPDEARVITEEDIHALAKTNLLEYHLYQEVGKDHEYHNIVKELSYFGVMVASFPKWEMKVNMPSYCSVPGYEDSREKALEMIESRKRIGKKLLQIKKDRYPLLKYIDIKHFNTPEMLEYRKFIDNKGEKGE